MFGPLYAIETPSIKERVMNKNGLLVMVAGGVLFSLVLFGQFYTHHKEKVQMKKTVSLLQNENKSLEHHLRHLEGRERVLLQRMKKTKEKLHSFGFSE